MNQSQIFISYSSKDYSFARKLYDELITDRYWVWIDKKNLEPAKEWEPQIDENLRKSKTFMVLISSNSVGSDWVKHEGSMAFALGQRIIPIKIEPFVGNLPIWAAPIQLSDLIKGSPDYSNQYQELKQLLGEPLPIRQHLKEMLIHYKNSGMLLDEVALTLIQRHYDDLYLTDNEKELADKLIEESKRKLEDYWERYEELEKSYDDAKSTISFLNKKHDTKVDLLTKEIESKNNEIESLKQEVKIGERIQEIFFIVIFIALTVFVFIVIMYLISLIS